MEREILLAAMMVNPPCCSLLYHCCFGTSEVCLFSEGSHSKFVCSKIGPSLTSLGMTTLFRIEQTTGFSHCKSDPTRLARTVKGKTRGHLSIPYDFIASSTDVGPELIAFASFLARTTASSNAQHAPCPRLGVIGCQASPTNTVVPVDGGGLMAGHSQRSTRGVLLIVSSGVRSIKFSSSDGQFLTSSLACFFNTDGSIVFGPKYCWKMSNHMRNEYPFHGYTLHAMLARCPS